MKTTTARTSLTVATVAMTPSLDAKASLERMRRVIEETKRDHPETRLIFFGETILGWFYKKGETREYHESIAETVPGPSTESIEGLAKAHDIYISYGLSERDGEKLFNTQVLVSPEGEILAKHRKFWIRNKIFTAGERRLTTATVDGAKLAILICADGRSLWLRRAIRRARVDIVLASLADYATSHRLNQLLGTLYGAWVLVANRYGEEPPIMWHGLITITDPWARLHGASLGKESVLVHRIPGSRSSDLGRWMRRRLVGLKLVLLLGAFAWESAANAIRTRKKNRAND